MALILNIETATTMCSVSIGKDGKLIELKELNGDYSHAENLTLFIKDVVDQAGINLSDLDAIAISKGPGSYTGLRIGVSTAKGLCYSLEKPLIAINTLEHLSRSVSVDRETLLCPMIDARRMEVYCAVFNHEGGTIRPTAAEIIDENSFAELLKSNKIVFMGDGAEKCKQTFSSNPNAVFVDGIYPSAKEMVVLSEKAFQLSKFEDVAYFEPYYLKDFVAGKKKEAS